MPKFRSGVWLATAGALTLALYGCGGRDKLPTTPVEGRVLYQGKPLTFGTVIFQPASGPYAKGEIQSDGTFRLGTYAKNDGAILGIHRVQIVCRETPPASKDASEDPGLGKSLIPLKYSAPGGSGLTAEVKEKNEPFTFELTGPAPR